MTQSILIQQLKSRTANTFKTDTSKKDSTGSKRSNLCQQKSSYSSGCAHAGHEIPEFPPR